MTDMPDRVQQREQAAEWHLEGTPLGEIAAGLDVTVTVAKKLLKEGLAERIGDATLAVGVLTEIARIDEMIVGLWVEARGGDVDAVDRVTKLQERRARLVAPRTNKHAMRHAFDRSVEASKEIKAGVDDGAVELGRQYADGIDEAVATTSGAELTKALYLGPHILGVLNALLATPASRAAADKGDSDEVGGKLRHLRSVAKQQQQQRGS